MNLSLYSGVMCFERFDVEGVGRVMYLGAADVGRLWEG